MLLHPRNRFFMSRCFCFLHFVHKCRNSVMGVIFQSNLFKKPISNSKYLGLHFLRFFHHTIVLNYMLRIRDIFYESGCGSGSSNPYLSLSAPDADLRGFHLYVHDDKKNQPNCRFFLGRLTWGFKSVFTLKLRAAYSYVTLYGKFAVANVN
jgi:hypothetical protein